MTDSIVKSRTTKSFLTSGQVGRLLGCSSFWVNILIARGELDTHRIGSTGWHRISVRTLEQYAQKHQVSLDWSLLQQ